jgi:hypothetical protein
MVIFGKVDFVPTFKQKVVKIDRSSRLLLINSNWTVTDSFWAAYIAWDRANNIHSSKLEIDRYFDYGEFPLQQFYNLILETTQNFENLEQATTIGIEVNKNPFLVSGEGIESFDRSQILTNTFLPNLYSTKDFTSKKNYLGLFIAHEIALSDRFYINFEGTFDVVIGDTTALPELPVVEPIENNNFYPELSLSYELTERVFLFATINYAAESIEGRDAKNRPFNSEVYRGIELGIETEIVNNWLTTFSVYRESQNDVTTIDPNEPDFDLQINQQINRSWTGEISGEITRGWWVYGYYSYSDAKVTEDEVIKAGNPVPGVASHTGGLWTSYEIDQGTWQGWGFGGGIAWNGNRPGDTANTFTLPSYLQTDAAIFYSQNNFRAAISVQNLFNTGREDEEVTERSLLGTVWFQF